MGSTFGEEGTFLPAVRAATPSSPPEHKAALNLLVAAWLDAKSSMSGSWKTKKSYEQTIGHFRDLLQSIGMDLDSDPAKIAMLAEKWAGRNQAGGAVAPSTYNERLYILSSFYHYAIKNELLTRNPIDRIERHKVNIRDAAQPMAADEVAERLAAIDCNDIIGFRDYTLLLLGFSTGRRISEIANLKTGHIQFIGSNEKKKILITWVRCKGGKVMRDEIEGPIKEVLEAWLEEIHQIWIVRGMEYLLILFSNSLSGYLKKKLAIQFMISMSSSINQLPVWPAFRGEHCGDAISTNGIINIAQKNLGTTKFHTLRHSFAIMMEDAGAKLSVIGDRLGHSSYATTSLYMIRLRSATNPHTDALASLLGLDKSTSWKQRHHNKEEEREERAYRP